MCLEFWFGFFLVLGFKVSELGSVFVGFEFGVSIFGNETNTETKLVAFEFNHRYVFIHLNEFHCY